MTGRRTRGNRHVCIPTHPGTRTPARAHVHTRTGKFFRHGGGSSKNPDGKGAELFGCRTFCFVKQITLRLHIPEPRSLSDYISQRGRGWSNATYPQQATYPRIPGRDGSPVSLIRGRRVRYGVVCFYVDSTISYPACQASRGQSISAIVCQRSAN